MTTITYIQRHTLRTRGPIASEADREVDGALLVGNEVALSYEDRHGVAGHDEVMLFPAFMNGARCWLERRSWFAARGYSAFGTTESLIDFETGVKCLIERGVFSFGSPDPQAAVAAAIQASPDDIVIGGKGGGPVVLPTGPADFDRRADTMESAATRADCGAFSGE